MLRVAMTQKLFEFSVGYRSRQTYQIVHNCRWDLLLFTFLWLVYCVLKNPPHVHSNVLVPPVHTSNSIGALAVQQFCLVLGVGLW